MRIWKFLAVGAAIAALQGTSFLTAAQPEIKQGSAVVRALDGNVTYRASLSQDWKVLKVDDVLKPGAEIKTGKGSSVDLFLNQNGPVVRVNEDALFAIRKLDRQENGAAVVTDTHLEVIAGSILGYTQKVSPGSKYLVTTPVCEAEITGTHYQVTAQGFVIVVTGCVNVKYTRIFPTKQHITASVNAGQTFDPMLGGVRATLPGDSLNIIANVNTAKHNARVFFTGGAKIVVKPKKIKTQSPTQGGDDDDDDSDDDDDDSDDDGGSSSSGDDDD